MPAVFELSGRLGVIMGPFIPNEVLTPMAEEPARPSERDGAAPAGDSESSFELLLKAKQGDRQAVERLWSRYLPRIRRWAHGRLPSSSRGLLDTDDLAQEILLRAIQHVDTFEPRHEGAFQGYLRQMLKNRIFDELRSAGRRPAGTTIHDEHAAPDPSPLELALGRETLDRYEAALQQLRPQDRELVVARFELDFSVAEIAAAFGKPSVPAAQMAVSRAVLKLAEVMGRA
jgi:RNA polymerase sigma factor (sigma-70 family)